ncbi:hypothetical protein MTBBW1_2280022 [Desulfamplus magnetovallimortis]|uniref:Uncharacterized protein n=1 Tax=Desulfamplus magnetovallimortis TaxID=1246637 RepID=A0A1W1HDC8_9BACT|nr:hypothetical protein MTBBW1_2280022 [Desulfamplus magnetovallimortis]
MMLYKKFTFYILYYIKELIFNNLPIHLIPQPPLTDLRGGAWESYFRLIPKGIH